MQAVPKKSGSSVHEPQLPSARINQIRDRFEKHLDDNRGQITQAKVAKAIDYSEGVISTWRKGTYAGNSADVALAIERYLTTFDRRRAAEGGLTFVRTSIARRVEDAIVMAEATRKIALIINDAGVGVTEALRHYRDAHEGAVLLECDPSMNGKWALLTALLDVVTSGGCRMRPADAMREIVQRLEGTDRTILVDEAHCLTKPECFEMLRRAADRAGVGLAICGNEHTYQGRGGNGGSALALATSYMQFERRIVRRLRLRASEIKRADLRLVLGQLLPASVLDDEMLAKFMAEAHSAGGIGRCIAVAQTARIVARSHEPQTKHVLRAFRVVTEEEEPGGDA
jgi:DNA transposition AAA+ family ATPase